MITQDEISVVCPTYNSATYVLGTLATVAAQLAQPAELIVSDDGSTDGTPEIAEKYFATCTGLRTRILRNPHAGPGAARNAGLRAAGGAWIAFVDADDLWRPDKLQMVATAARADGTRNFFCHSEEHRHLDGSTSLLDYGAAYDAARPLPAQLFSRNLFSTSAVVCRRELFEECGFFDEKLMSAQDYEQWLRMSPHLRVGFIREVLGSYVDRPGNITSSNLEKRIWNEVSVKYRHRDKATWALYGLTMGKLVAYYLKAKLKNIGSR